VYFRKYKLYVNAGDVRAFVPSAIALTLHSVNGSVDLQKQILSSYNFHFHSLAVHSSSLIVLCIEQWSVRRKVILNLVTLLI